MTIEIKKNLLTVFFGVISMVFASLALASGRTHTGSDHGKNSHKPTAPHSLHQPSKTPSHTTPRKSVSDNSKGKANSPVQHSLQQPVKDPTHSAQRRVVHTEPAPEKSVHKNTVNKKPAHKNSFNKKTINKKIANKNLANKKTLNKKTGHKKSVQKHPPHLSVTHSSKHQPAIHTASTGNYQLICAKNTSKHNDTCSGMQLIDAHGHPISPARLAQVHAAKETAISKLMHQLGKPYHWGGSSPSTGFDCSGLVYFAYKDLVNFPIPRTANDMYHLRDAAPVPFNELKVGDLVFFHTESQSKVDHVGVYVGDGKFIQSPRTGKDVKITSLHENYWKQHYIGARRIVTPRTVR